MNGREKEIVGHLSEEELDRLLAETDDEKVSKRLTFVKRLYKGSRLLMLPTMLGNPGLDDARSRSSFLRLFSNAQGQGCDPSPVTSLTVSTGFVLPPE